MRMKRQNWLHCCSSGGATLHPRSGAMRWRRHATAVIRRSRVFFWANPFSVIYSRMDFRPSIYPARISRKTVSDALIGERVVYPARPFTLVGYQLGLLALIH